MTFALLTRNGGLIIVFQSSGCEAMWVMIICPTLQFSVSSCTTRRRPVLRTDCSIAALSHGTMERRSINSTLVSLPILSIASRDFSTVLPHAINVTSRPSRCLRAWPRGTAQTGCIFGCARNDDGQTRVMSKHALVRLTMPQTSAGKISAIRRVNDGGTFPITERAPAQRREVCNQLIEAGVNKIDELKFEDRALAVGRETAGDAEDGRFGEWRIENLFWKFGRKFLR